MVTEVSENDLRQNLKELLSRVEGQNETILISKDGRRVAALVDAHFYDRISRVRDRFEELRGRIAEDYAKTPIEIGLAEIDAVVAAQRPH